MVARSSALSDDGTQALLQQSVNGTQVPVEKTETRTLSESASGKVTETVVRHYGPDGQILSTDRTVTEERKRPGGGTATTATLQRSDMNGALREVERRATETKTDGKTTTSEVVISRLGVDNRITPDEKHVVVTTGDDKKTHEDEQIFKASTSGQFTQTARNVTDHTVNGDKTTTQTAHYQTDYQGRIQLDNLKVTNTEKGPNGAQTTEVNTYGYPPGVARTDAPPTALQSQQVITRTTLKDGTMAETLSVRLPSLSDANRLGPANVVSQKVCAGKCDAPKP
jgi:hypothetical protein